MEEQDAGDAVLHRLAIAVDIAAGRVGITERQPVADQVDALVPPATRAQLCKKHFLDKKLTGSQ